MNSIELALIGCGALGRIHAQCISKIPKASFAAFADINEDAAKTALADFGGRYATRE